jgi:hypothetical protein
MNANSGQTGPTDANPFLGAPGGPSTPAQNGGYVPVALCADPWVCELTLVPAPGLPGYVPNNAMSASSGSSDQNSDESVQSSSSANSSNSAADTSASSGSGGAAANAVGAAREQAVADAAGTQ